MSITNIINENHRVVWKSESLNSLDEVEIICLCEIHNDSDLKIKNGSLINRINKECHINEQNILVLVEEESSLEMTEQLSNFIRNDQYIENDVVIKGWDKKNKKSLTLYEQYIKLYTVKEKKTKSGKKRLIKEMKKIYPHAAHQINNKTINYFYSNLVNKLFASVKKDFINRTDSLINSIEKSDDQFQIRFVIAGRHHFIQIEDSDKKKQFSVQPLIDFLQHKKAIILDYLCAN